MTVDENVTLMRKWFDDVWNHGDFQIVRDRMMKGAVGYGQSERQNAVHGPEEFIAFASRLRGAFPDMKLVVEDAFGAGDRVAIRWSADMNHLGDHLGIPPTRKPVRISGITIVHIENGQVTEGWDCWDQAGMMRQIGVAGFASSPAEV